MQFLAMEKNVLPPGQRLLSHEKWPLLGVGKPPVFDPKTWKLVVNGLVENTLEFSWEEFNRLPKIRLIADMSCVTRWTVFDIDWEGVDFYEILKLAKPKPQAISVQFKAWDDVGYTTSVKLNQHHKLFIPKQEGSGEVDLSMGFIGVKRLVPTGEKIELNEVILATKNADLPLTSEHGAPMRVVIPRLYAWKGCKWCNEITFMNTHELGFWEKIGYSDTADPDIQDRTENPEAQKKKIEIYRQQREKGI